MSCRLLLSFFVTADDDDSSGKIEHMDAYPVVRTIESYDCTQDSSVFGHLVRKKVSVIIIIILCT